MVAAMWRGLAASSCSGSSIASHPHRACSRALQQFCSHASLSAGSLLVSCDMTIDAQSKSPLRKHKVGQCLAFSSSTSSSYKSPGNGRKSSLRARELEVRQRSEEPLERFFATCSPGLEEIVAAELRSALIGATLVQVGSAGVSFCGTKRIGVIANLWLRSATRVLLELASGPLPRGRPKDPVYEFVREAADWPALLIDDSVTTSSQAVSSEDKNRTNPGKYARIAKLSDKVFEGDYGKLLRRNQRWKFRTFSVSSRVWDCAGVTSSMFATVRAKDAVCDAVRDACQGSRPDPPEDGFCGADVPLFLSLYRGNATLYRDMTGISLHKRGYRDVMHRAGLNETIAAAVLSVAGWNRWLPEIESSNRRPGGNAEVLMDPMCGSGTLLIEAALMAINSAPGLMRRHWPFETWHDFSPSLLSSCRNEAMAAQVSPPQGLRLLGNDIHEGALSLCIRAAEAANIRSMLELSCKDCREYCPSVSPSLVVVNPPWGERLEDSRNNQDSELLLTTWQALGRFLKTNCSLADVYVLSGNSSVTHAMHMKADKKWPVNVGGIDCRIMHYYVLPPRPPKSLEAVS